MYNGFLPLSRISHGRLSTLCTDGRHIFSIEIPISTLPYEQYDTSYELKDDIRYQPFGIVLSNFYTITINNHTLELEKKQEATRGERIITVGDAANGLAPQNIKYLNLLRESPNTTEIGITTAIDKELKGMFIDGQQTHIPSLRARFGPG